MDISSLKSTAFGGYDKKSVHDFIEEVSMSYAVKITEITEEKGALTDKIAELENKIASLEESLGNSEKEKDYVANAIVTAEKEAAKILANAALEAEELKTNTRNELKDEFELLKDLRLSTFQAMTQYKDKLDAISRRLNGDE